MSVGILSACLVQQVDYTVGCAAESKMLLFLSDLPLNGSAYTAAESDDADAIRDYHYALFVRSIYDYYVPLLIAVGLLCNIASVVILGHNRTEDSGGDGVDDHWVAPVSLYVDDSYDTYLSSRAVADCAFLLCLFVVWLDTVDIPMYTTAGWCQVRVFNVGGPVTHRQFPPLCLSTYASRLLFNDQLQPAKLELIKN